jgi:hypothetical protein
MTSFAEGAEYKWLAALTTNAKGTLFSSLARTMAADRLRRSEHAAQRSMVSRVTATCSLRRGTPPSTGVKRRLEFFLRRPPDALKRIQTASGHAVRTLAELEVSTVFDTGESERGGSRGNLVSAPFVTIAVGGFRVTPHDSAR